MSAEYMARKCKDCIHLEAMEFEGLEAQRNYRCRERLHVIGQPTQRGMMLMSMYASVPPTMEACSHFQNKEGVGETARRLIDMDLGPESAPVRFTP